MIVKRTVLFGLTGIAAIVVALSLMSGLPSTFTAAIFDSMNPSRVSWAGKSAYVKCAGAIANPVAWPAAPSEACEAMHMCANEAPLSANERRLLAEAVQKTQSCPKL
jgi:hypothetical protein